MRDIAKALSEDNLAGPKLIQSYAFSEKRNVSVLQKVRSLFRDLTGVGVSSYITRPPYLCDSRSWQSHLPRQAVSSLVVMHALPQLKSRQTTPKADHPLCS
jgi:hypothetical protein